MCYLGADKTANQSGGNEPAQPKQISELTA